MGASIPFVRSPLLESPGIAHAFFTREGGVSEGIYASLNGGAGSRDAPEAVAENKRRMAHALGVEPHRLLVPYQVHSAHAQAIDAPWRERPHCDGVVTATRGLALGVTGADCGIVLFCDEGAGVIGAAHAGWKGALDGVLDATLEQMERLGASRPAIRAVLGPTISREVPTKSARNSSRVSLPRTRATRGSSPTRRTPAKRCSIFPATSARVSWRRAWANSRTSPSTPMATISAFTRIAAPFTAANPTSAASSQP